MICHCRQICFYKFHNFPTLFGLHYLKCTPRWHGSVYFMLLLLILLMSWKFDAPGHRQAWYKLETPSWSQVLGSHCLNYRNHYFVSTNVLKTASVTDTFNYAMLKYKLVLSMIFHVEIKDFVAFHFFTHRGDFTHLVTYTWINVGSVSIFQGTCQQILCLNSSVTIL